MRPADNIEKLIRKLHYETSAETHDKIYGNVMQTLDEKQKEESGTIKPDKWRIIMKTKATKLGAAAVIIACIVLYITFMEKTVTPAYSFEQTLQAIQNLRTMHMVCKDWSGNKFEMWIELDPETGIPEVFARTNKRE
jgi:hypothetical protein